MAPAVVGSSPIGHPSLPLLNLSIAGTISLPLGKEMFPKASGNPIDQPKITHPFLPILYQYCVSDLEDLD